MKRIISSFRDREATVFINDQENKILRSFSDNRIQDISNIMQSKFFSNNKKKFVDTVIEQNQLVHTKIDFICHPYELPFYLLAKSALLQLELQIEAIDENIIFSDCSPFNVQYDYNTKPIFIDFGSLKLYEQNQPWYGYKQFCEFYLAPLSLESYNNINYQKLLNHSIEGLDLSLTSKLLSKKSYLNFNIFLNIHLHAKILKKITSKSKVSQKKYILTKHKYKSLLVSLKNTIEKFKSSNETYWSEYGITDSYEKEALLSKEDALKNFVKKNRIQTLLDIGCNECHFSKLALKNGALRSIAIDNDLGSLNKAAEKIDQENLNILPLYIDLLNPTPGSGYMNKERESFLNRCKNFDGMIAFAIIHHLFISGQLPLDYIVKLLVSLAPNGLIEFVKKEDFQFQELMSTNKFINLEEYSEEIFEKNLIENNCKFVKINLPNSSRVIYEYNKY